MIIILYYFQTTKLPPNKNEVMKHKKAVINPTNNICIPYLIILSSLILARYKPNKSNDNIVNVIDE